MLKSLLRRYAALVCLVTVLGCSSNNTQTASGACSSQPPSNINVALCESISGGPDSTKIDQCSACCTAGGYSQSSFINNNQCTCGNSQADAGANVSVCATQTGSSDACQTCCQNAGYEVSGSVNGQTCECSMRTDKTICNSALSNPQPAMACDCCCLSNGYISDMYIGIGTPECSCIGA